MTRCYFTGVLKALEDQIPYTLCHVCVRLPAAQVMIDEGKLELLQQMYREWPFFSVTLDMIEMVFAKADPRVAQARSGRAAQAAAGMTRSLNGYP